MVSVIRHPNINVHTNHGPLYSPEQNSFRSIVILQRQFVEDRWDFGPKAAVSAKYGALFVTWLFSSGTYADSSEYILKLVDERNQLWVIHVDPARCSANAMEVAERSAHEWPACVAIFKRAHYRQETYR